MGRRSGEENERENERIRKGKEMKGNEMKKVKKGGEKIRGGAVVVVIVVVVVGVEVFVVEVKVNNDDDIELRIRMRYETRRDDT